MAVKWKSIDINQIIKYCEDTYNRYGVYPSIREIFYAFIDRLWPNSKISYIGLSVYLTKKRATGEIDWQIMRDGSGREISSGDSTYRTPEDFFESHLRWFKECAEDYKLPKWTGQKNKVVVLCEKEADFPVVKAILRDINVDVGYMRGYSGKRIMYELATSFQEDENRTPVIILLGDFDPSGTDIKRNVREDMSDMGVQVRPLDIAVTKEQIEKFKLPHRPEDADEIQKLQNDPRFANWPWGLYRVETAALRVMYPDYFDKLLRDTVLQFFDQKIYEDPKKVEQEKKAREDIQEMIENVLNDGGM
jgi:5S rRNA maturation endonuclease (ribonuclease M5)